MQVVLVHQVSDRTLEGSLKTTATISTVFTYLQLLVIPVNSWFLATCATPVYVLEGKKVQWSNKKAF